MIMNMMKITVQWNKIFVQLDHAMEGSIATSIKWALLFNIT